jgi:hypothetical protein
MKQILNCQRLRLILGLVCNIVLLWSFGIAALAQKSGGNTKKKGARKATLKTFMSLSPQQQQAFLLLDTLAEKARSLENGRVKIIALARIANILWDYDEPRARRLFSQAFSAIGSVKLSGEEDKTITLPGGADVSGPLFQLRLEVLQMIGRRSPQLAQELQEKNTRPETLEPEVGRQNVSNVEKDIHELKLAISLSKDEPEKAAQIIRNNLQHGIHEVIGMVLLGIKHENPNLANQLFKEALLIARKDIANLDNLTRLLPFIMSGPENSGTDIATDPTQLDVAKQFLNYAADFVTTRLNSNEPSPSSGETNNKEVITKEFQTLKALFPLFNKYLPEKASVIQTRLAMLASTLSSRPSASTEEADEESVDELLEKAETASSSRKKDFYYIKAAMAVYEKGEVERSLTIAEKIAGAEDRDKVLSLIRSKEASKSLAQGDINTAIRHAEKIMYLPNRVTIFNAIARKLLAQKEENRARALLEDIWGWVKKTDDSPHKVTALLILIQTMANIDTPRGFDFLRITVKAIDDTNFIVAKEKPRGLMVEFSAITIAALDFSRSLAPLVRADFAQTLQFAQLLKNKEAATLAQLAVCQEILQSNSGQSQ